MKYVESSQKKHTRRRSGVFIVDSENISHFFSVSFVDFQLEKLVSSEIFC